MTSLNTNDALSCLGRKKSTHRVSPNFDRINLVRKNSALKKRIERNMEELRPRSHRYSKACKQLMILILLTIFVGYLEADISVDPTHIRGPFEEAAKICHCSYKHMRHQWSLFEEHGRVKSPTKRGRKRIEPSICYEGENLSCEHIVHIQESI